MKTKATEIDIFHRLLDRARPLLLGARAPASAYRPATIPSRIRYAAIAKPTGLRDALVWLPQPRSEVLCPVPVVWR